MNSMELLEVLSFRCGCMYLSDLKKPQMLPMIRHYLRKIHAEDYSLREWTDAIHYLLQKEGTFASCEQAKAYLLGNESV